VCLAVLGNADPSLANPRKGNHVRDAHTKGPRGNRPARNLPSGGHPSTGGAGRRPYVPNTAGDRRQFERKSGTIPDSQKKVEQGWGANEGAAELTGQYT
jgi:plasminogen activator inhibitor 1 RNA-binding protein